MPESERSELFSNTKPNNSALNAEITSKKQFIGGYKHKLTGKVYHHAVVQTLPSPWKHELLRFHRDAQTAELQDQAQQTTKNTCTQVQAKYIFISSSNDKHLACTGNFKYADDIKKEFLEQVIILQKHARRWLAYQEVLKRKKITSFQQAWDERKNKLYIDWLKSMEDKRLNPKNEEDFMLLFSDVQKWWLKEAKSITGEKSEPEVKAAMTLLVNEESKKISEINRRKLLLLQKQNREFKEKSLEMAAKPKLWKGYNFVVQVETANTYKGRYLQELYQTLCMKNISSYDRISALTVLKEELQPYHCRLSENLIQLANREVDLLLRRTKKDRLMGLRNRIQDLFWQFMKQPVNNPQIKTKEKNQCSRKILRCTSCKQFYGLKPNEANEKLGKSISSNYFLKCSKCSYIENEAWIRKDSELYKKLLQFLIKEEENKSNISGLIYIIQPFDIKYLVEKIWKWQSCISGSTDKENLELIRYDSEESWTPWNCLLVTRQEAQTLQRTPNPETKYDMKFKKCVAQRHAEAKMYFSQIPRFFPFVTNLSFRKQ